MSALRFTLQQHSPDGIRRGFLHLPHGDVSTPFFMPIATKGAVKTLSALDLENLGAEIILSNTYHQFLRPGVELIKKAGGLHAFIGWKKPILTDSGGFQIFSLGKRGAHGRGGQLSAPTDVGDAPPTNIAPPRVTEEGVEFQSPLDGAKHFLTPEDAVQIQLDLGSDIIMVLDHLVGYPATREEAKEAMERSVRWAERSLNYFKNHVIARRPQADVAIQEESQGSGLLRGVYTERSERTRNDVSRPLLFAIVQGGVYDDLRIECAKQLAAMDFDGFAIGGLAVGEPEEEMYRVLDLACPLLPVDKPRYLMGVGYPHQIAAAVARGVDMFDCVIPTREARHGRVYLKSKIINQKSGTTARENVLNIFNEKFREDFTPISPDSRMPELRQHSLAYLRHLFVSGEVLGQRLATLNNLEVFLEMMRGMREN